MSSIKQFLTRTDALAHATYGMEGWETRVVPTDGEVYDPYYDDGAIYLSNDRLFVIECDGDKYLRENGSVF